MTAIGGPTFSVVLIVSGVAAWLAVIFMVPINLDNMHWHLAVTGICSVIVGVGVSRTRLGRKRFR